MRTLAVEPPPMLDKEERKVKFINRNGNHVCFAFSSTPAKVGSASFPSCHAEAKGAYHLWEKSGWCNRCIMVRDMPNSTDQPDEIALTIYLSGVSSISGRKRPGNRGFIQMVRNFSAVSFRIELVKERKEKEEYL